jgi:hypothetical protein
MKWRKIGQIHSGGSIGTGASLEGGPGGACGIASLDALQNHKAYARPLVAGCPGIMVYGILKDVIPFLVVEAYAGEIAVVDDIVEYPYVMA